MRKTTDIDVYLVFLSTRKMLSDRTYEQYTYVISLSCCSFMTEGRDFGLDFVKSFYFV